MCSCQGLGLHGSCLHAHDCDIRILYPQCDQESRSGILGEGVCGEGL